MMKTIRSQNLVKILKLSKTQNKAKKKQKRAQKHKSLKCFNLKEVLN